MKYIFLSLYFQLLIFESKKDKTCLNIHELNVPLKEPHSTSAPGSWHTNPHSLAGSLFLKENKSHFKPNLMDKIEARAKETKYQSWSKPRSAHKIVTIFFACFKTWVWVPWWKENSKAVEARAVPLEYVYSPLQWLLRRGSHLFGYIIPDTFVLKISLIILVSYLMFSFMFPLKTFYSNLPLKEREKEREKWERFAWEGPWVLNDNFLISIPW